MKQPCHAAIASYFTGLSNHLSLGKHAALLRNAESFLFAVKELVKESGGEITYHKTASEATKIP